MYDYYLTHYHYNVNAKFFKNEGLLPIMYPIAITLNTKYPNIIPYNAKQIIGWLF